MAEKSKEELVRDYIDITRQHFATYHNHKEYMAYIVTTFYLAGVTALLVSDAEHLKSIAASHCFVFSAMSLLALCVIGFIGWQLFMRMRAATIVAACDSLRVQWFTQPLDRLNTSPCYCKGIQMPCFLRDELRLVARFSLKQWILIAIPVALATCWHVLFLMRLAAAHHVSGPFPFTCIINYVFQ